MIHLYLLDDHELTRTGFKYILGREKDIQVVGDAGEGEAALTQIRKLKPDVLLCDLYLPGVSGLEVTERIVTAGIATRVIILSAQEEGPMPRRVMETGAFGYLCKGCSPQEMIRAVRTVSRGERYLGGRIAQHLALDSLRGPSASPFCTLTSREFETILLLVQGMRIGDIADRLNLSEKTVSSHKYNAFEKLGVRDLASMVKLALRFSVLDPMTV